MNEKRLIDANAVEAEIRKLAEKHFANGDIEFSNGVMKSVTRIRSAPTIDAAVVVRGRWIHQVGRRFSCNMCGRDVRTIYSNSETKCIADFPYCHCGAKMDKETST